jgi:hypothetical protein
VPGGPYNSTLTPGALRCTALRSSAHITWTSSATNSKSPGVSEVRGAGRVNTAIRSLGSRYSRISTGGNCSLTFIRSARSVMLCSEIRFSTMPMRSSREPARKASATSRSSTHATRASIPKASCAFDTLNSTSSPRSSRW